MSPGRVIGLDAAPGVLEHARAHAAEEAVDNVRFVAGDIYDLDVPDAEFDVVYANQLLQHLADPVRAIGEMRRVLKPGGLLAVRDADYATMCPYPKFAGVSRLESALSRGRLPQPRRARRRSHSTGLGSGGGIL